MKIDWEFIAECSPGAADYGGLLHLFEAQQRSLFERDPESSPPSWSSRSKPQARALADCRLLGAGGRLLRHRPRPVFDQLLRALLPDIAPDARPLIEALINEVNALLHRVRRTSRHHHTLLSRAVEVHQDTAPAAPAPRVHENLPARRPPLRRHADPRGLRHASSASRAD